MRFSFTLGIAPTFVLAKNVPNKKDLDLNYGAVSASDEKNFSITDKWFDGSPVRISFFAGTGFHFGNRRYNKEIREKRKQKEQLNHKSEVLYEN
jgi:hypothetical protein